MFLSINSNFFFGVIDMKIVKNIFLRNTFNVNLIL